MTTPIKHDPMVRWTCGGLALGTTALAVSAVLFANNTNLHASEAELTSRNVNMLTGALFGVGATLWSLVVGYTLWNADTEVKTK